MVQRPILLMLLILVGMLGSQCHTREPLTHVERWDVFEIAMSGPSSGNPYLDVNVQADFSLKDRTIRVPGFYDGKGIYRIRFSPDEEGDWSFETLSSEEELTGKTGSFLCVPPTEDNHGPVQVTNTHYLQYADGTPYYAVGTTAYQWTSVKHDIQEQTIETLEQSPFNKVRMCVFPKSYKYGNDTEPWQYPYRRVDTVNYHDEPNYDFFQNFDRRIAQLRDRGIQADVILFHPYDQDWDYYLMGSERNQRYVRYMIARISAYRNVWWSLANEWDIPAIKAAIDWEGIGTLLQSEDPHDRLRGIHNWYNTEDHFYDHSEPWITHTSTQTAQFYYAIKWRQRYRKPLLFDEMRYEGDVPSGWGNLTGQEMASYFWMAGLSGGYGTHGETFHNTSDTVTEVRWWAKGGTLVGGSADRIAFFRGIMEDFPFHQMKPTLEVTGDSSHLESNIYTLAQPGENYLSYVADSGSTVSIDIPTGRYDVAVIDTWNMTELEAFQIDGGTFTYPTTVPYTALTVTATR